jgi:DNA-binding response OmpR family regulator
MKENETSQAKKPAGASSMANGTACRILVVDDYREIRQLSTKVLMHSGYAVDAADDGAAAWEAMQIKPYNLLVTDNDMPRLTGVELVRKLRSARMAMPVIMVSGDLRKEELTQNRSLQLAAMLPKPFSPEELLGTVTNVLSMTNSAPAGSNHSQTCVASQPKLLPVDFVSRLTAINHYDASGVSNSTARGHNVAVDPEMSFFR